MVQNPNWPVIEDGWAPFWNCNGGDSPLDRYVDVTDRTRGSNGTQRGKQYELDQVQSGTYSVTLANTDGVLDPTNAAGPYAGHILPYQPYRKRAQWPPTINLLTQVQATAGDLGGQPLGAINGGNSGPSIFTATDSGGGQFVTSATAWQGSTVMQFQVPASTATGEVICYTPQVDVLPGQTYTVQMRVRNVTASSSVQVAVMLRTKNAANAYLSQLAGTAATLTGSTTAAWTTVTITATADANSAFMYVGLLVAATSGAACAVQIDGWQVEKGATASTWVQPGVTYPMYGGFVERWPSQWTMGGTYGTVAPTAVDAFSLLSQRKLSDPLTMEINNNAPRFLYKLDDPAGSSGATDSTGTYPAAPVAAGKYGPGSLAFGSSITSAAASGAYTGSTGTVVTINNPNPGSSLIGGATYLSLTSAGITGPSSTAWTRMLAFRYTGPAVTSLSYLWTTSDKPRPSVSHIYLYLNSSGNLQWEQQGPTSGFTIPFNNSVNVADGNWHLAIWGHDGTAFACTSLDGTFNSYAVGSAAAATNLSGDSLGNWVDITNGGGTTWNYKGDLSFAAEFPSLLSSGNMSNLYTAWRSSCSGESTSARYSRILRYSGYIGPSSVQTGLTTSMGPANIDGQDATSALQAVVDTEGGAHYVDKAGTVVFKSRSARYNALTPVYTFGERADLGEWPYEDVKLDFDPTHLSNVITVTQASTGQTFTAQDATSKTDYFPRTLSRTINSSSALECQDAADYLLSRYAQPVSRVSGIKLHPSANPALWPVCLSLELGMRVRIMRRPPAPAPAIQIEAFIEQIQTSMDDQGEAYWTLQCSPADTTPYGIFAAWHTTLNVGVLAGATSVTLKAGQDNTNPLATQLAPGQQLVLGQGAASGGSTIRNLALNPSTEVDLSNTQAYGTSQTRTWINTDAEVGTACIQHTHTAAGSNAGSTYSIESTTGTGTVIQIGLWIKIPAGGISSGSLAWRNSTTTLKLAAITVPTTSAWTRLTGSYTLAAGEVCDRVGVSLTGANGTVWLADACMAETGSTLHTYGDGSTTGYWWEGTANASVSRSAPTVAETVTVQSVGATSPGWTTAVVTLTAATTQTHATGDTVCEPLPAGTTDPTTWDASATFDDVAFAY